MLVKAAVIPATIAHVWPCQSHIASTRLREFGSCRFLVPCHISPENFLTYLLCRVSSLMPSIITDGLQMAFAPGVALRLDAVRWPGAPRSFDGLSMSLRSDPRVCHSASAPVLCAPSPASLGCRDANGGGPRRQTARTSRSLFVGRSGADQPVFCRPAATPETVQRIR